MDEIEPYGTTVDRRSPPCWSSPWDCCRLIAKGYTARTAATVAAVVGTVLSAVNEGTFVISGRVDATTVVRIVVNYLVPFIVASVGYLAPFRQPRRAVR